MQVDTYCMQGNLACFMSPADFFYFYILLYFFFKIMTEKMLTQT